MFQKLHSGQLCGFLPLTRMRVNLVLQITQVRVSLTSTATSFGLRSSAFLFSGRDLPGPSSRRVRKLCAVSTWIPLFKACWSLVPPAISPAMSA